MASKKTLNVQNLQALGAERLAALLIEISAGNAAAKRRLRLELAGAQSPAEVAREVRNRRSHHPLPTLGNSTTAASGRFESQVICRRLSRIPRVILLVPIAGGLTAQALARGLRTN